MAYTAPILITYNNSLRPPSLKVLRILLTSVAVHRPRPVLLLASLPMPCASVHRRALATTPTRSSLVPSVLATDASTAVRHPKRIRRQHYRGNLCMFHKMLAFLVRPARRAGLSRRLLLCPECCPAIPATFLDLRVPPHLLRRRALVLLRCIHAAEIRRVAGLSPCPKTQSASRDKKSDLPSPLATPELNLGTPHG